MKKNLLGISTLTLVGLYALLSVIVLGVCLFTGIPLQYGLIGSIIVLILQFLLAPFFTDLTVKWFYHANFNAEIPTYLKEYIQSICEKEKIKYPKIAVIDDGAPNAFTYGRFKNDARIVVSRGIFELLNEEEVKAVVSHEIGHIVHLDMLFMTVAQLVPLVLYSIYESLSKRESSSNNSKDYSEIIAIVAYVLYIISQYIILWLSRTREYYADEYSALSTGNPNALASSLVKIGFGLSINSEKETPEEDNNKKKQKTKHSVKDIGALGIFDSKTSKSLIVSTNNNVNDKSSIKNAMKWEMWNPWAFIYELQSTHPLISKRLLRISNYSKDFNQEPYIVFDLQKEESYVDDFFIELVIKYLPVLTLLLTIVLFFVIPSTSNSILCVGIGGFITTLFSFLKFRRNHKSSFKTTNVKNLLGEIKVSGVTSIPCEIEGKVIGKGDPGSVFSEDFIVQDETGIMFLDYNQPLFILNKIFALFKSQNYIDKSIKIKGWYRRSPVPYIEIYTMECEGKQKKIFTYNLSRILYVLIFIVFIFITIYSFI